MLYKCCFKLDTWETLKFKLLFEKKHKCKGLLKIKWCAGLFRCHKKQNHLPWFPMTSNWGRAEGGCSKPQLNWTTCRMCSPPYASCVHSKIPMPSTPPSCLSWKHYLLKYLHIIMVNRQEIALDNKSCIEISQSTAHLSVSINQLKWI